MCRPSKIDDQCVDLRRSTFHMLTFEDWRSMCWPSKIDDWCVGLRRSMVDVRASKIDVSTFEDWRSMCRPSKINGRCVDLQRSMIKVSTFETGCIYPWRINTTIIVVNGRELILRKLNLVWQHSVLYCIESAWLAAYAMHVESRTYMSELGTIYGVRQKHLPCTVRFTPEHLRET